MMGNKYIIEIEESYSRDGWPNEDTPDVLYRVKGFNSLVFDQRGLNKLEKYDPDKMAIDDFQRGYDVGLNDAWEAAKRIVNPSHRGGLTPCELRKLFGITTGRLDLIFNWNSAAEAVAKIKAYEEKQKAEAEIRVGDEVVVNGLTGVVMKLDEKGNVDRYFTCDGRTFGNISGFQNNEVKKTGRHFPEVGELLEKMKEGNEDD